MKVLIAFSLFVAACSGFFLRPPIKATAGFIDSSIQSGTAAASQALDKSTTAGMNALKDTHKFGIQTMEGATDKARDVFDNAAGATANVPVLGKVVGASAAVGSGYVMAANAVGGSMFTLTIHMYDEALHQTNVFGQQALSGISAASDAIFGGISKN